MISEDITIGAPERIGLLGGSFNPVHNGHLMLASYLSQWGYVDQVWLTLTPRNPLKDTRNLLPDVKRLQMLNLAIKGAVGIDICDIELSMPRPNYTINTLDLLRDRYPNRQFRLIIGSDNWRQFDKWRDYQRILDEYGVIVYPRSGFPIANPNADGIEVVDAPMVNLSSTFIRDAIRRGRDMNYFMPQLVCKYIRDNNFYK